MNCFPDAVRARANITDCVSYPIDPDIVYNLEIRINGNNFTGYIDSEKIISGVDNNYEVGSVGLSAHIGTVHFDNFTVCCLPRE